MPDYEKMYYKLFAATLRVMDELVAVQRGCEELLLMDAEKEGEDPPAD